jgi:hypothetical protein
MQPTGWIRNCYQLRSQARYRISSDAFAKSKPNRASATLQICRPRHTSSLLVGSSRPWPAPAAWTCLSGAARAAASSATSPTTDRTRRAATAAPGAAAPPRRWRPSSTSLAPECSSRAATRTPGSASPRRLCCYRPSRCATARCAWRRWSPGRPRSSLRAGTRTTRAASRRGSRPGAPARSAQRTSAPATAMASSCAASTAVGWASAGASLGASSTSGSSTRTGTSSGLACGRDLLEVCSACRDRDETKGHAFAKKKTKSHASRRSRRHMDLEDVFVS